MKHKENEREQTGNPVHKRKFHSGLIVKMVLGLVTIGLCAYTISALVGVNGRNIFTVNSTLGSLYANTYRYAVILSVLSLLAWIVWAVVFRGRKKRNRKS